MSSFNASGNSAKKFETLLRVLRGELTLGTPMANSKRFTQAVMAVVNVFGISASIYRQILVQKLLPKWHSGTGLLYL